MKLSQAQDVFESVYNAAVELEFFVSLIGLILSIDERARSENTTVSRIAFLALLILQMWYVMEGLIANS